MTLPIKAPIHYTERIRQILYALAWAFLLERATPAPWLQGPYGRMTYFIVLFFVIKNIIRYRQEKSARFYAKTLRWKAWWAKRKIGFSDYTRFRIARVFRYFFFALAVGWVVDASTDKCEGALNCAVQIPSLLVQNVQSLVDFALRLALGMSSLFIMMWVLARQDLYDLMLPESIETRFTDVYGQEKAVQSVKEALAILNNPVDIEEQGGYMPAGILLSGPPGVGKSYLAQAAAGEASKPFVSVDGSSFSSMWMGVPLMKVKMIFRHLRKLSVKYGGVVVFFDEIDVLGSRGGSVINQAIAKAIYKDAVVVTQGGGSGALQMMLTEMSGLAKSKGFYNRVRVFLGFKPLPPPKYRILWMAATNLPQALDPAMLRPGRFDRKLHMGYPQVAGRVETFAGYLDRIKNDLTEQQVEALARENPQATGASIKDAVNEGLLKAIREGRDTVTFEDMRYVILTKSMGESEGVMELEEDKRRTALHEAGHAVASHYFRPYAPIQYASMAKRGDMGGFVKSADAVDSYKTRSRLMADIRVSLASVWSEKTYFDDNISTGPSSDLKKATKIAKAMWGQWAMGNTVMVFEDDEIPAAMLEAIQDWLQELYDDTAEFMNEHMDDVEAVADLLMEMETVDGSEVHALLEKTE